MKRRRHVSKPGDIAMSRIVWGLAALGALALLSFVQPATAAPKPNGVSNAEQVNLSARRYYRRAYRPYYRPYYRHYGPRFYYGAPYPYYGAYYPRYYRPYYYRPYYYRPYPFFPFAPWW
jgi:hypothetical protein